MSGQVYKQACAHTAVLQVKKRRASREGRAWSLLGFLGQRARGPHPGGWAKSEKCRSFATDSCSSSWEIESWNPCQIIYYNFYRYHLYYMGGWWSVNVERSCKNFRGVACGLLIPGFCVKCHFYFWIGGFSHLGTVLRTLFL